jgi:ligand-binding sensor domain-containing protein
MLYIRILAGLLALWAARPEALVRDSARLWTGSKTRALAFDPAAGTWQQFFLPGTVYDIDRDRQGGLWFATQAGPAKYSQGEWRYFSPANTRDSLLSDDNIQCLAFGGTGRLWIGTGQGGIMVFDRDLWTRHSITTGLAHNKVNALLAGAGNQLWAGTADGLCFWDGKKWRGYTRTHGLVGNFIRSLGRDGTGRVWAECYNYTGHTVADVQGGLAWFDGNRWQSRVFAEPIVRCGLENGFGPVAVTKGPGTRPVYYVYSFINNVWHTDSASLRINDAAMDSLGRTWAGTAQGLYIIEKGDWRLLPETNGRDVTRVWQDRTGGKLWCATTGPTGTTMGTYDGTTWTFSPLFPKKTITAMAQAGQTVWFATTDGLLSYDGRSWETVDAHVSVSRYVKTVVAAPRGDVVWIGTERGLACREQGTWRPFFNNGLARQDVYSVVCDHHDTVWAYAGQWHYYSRNTWTPLNELFGIGRRGLPLEQMDLDARNGKWFYSPEAPDVKCYSEGALREYTGIPAALGQLPALCATSSKNNALWLADQKTMFAYNHGAAPLVRQDAPGQAWQALPCSPLAITMDSAGTVSMCERYRVMQVRGTALTVVPLPDHLRFRDVRADPAGALWIEGEQELLCYQDRRCIIYPFPAKDKTAATEYIWQPVAETMAIASLVADTGRNVWASSSAGVFLYTPGGVQPLAAADAPAAKHINKIILDSRGALWAIHNFGASRLRGPRWEHYDIRDGLLSNLLYDIFPARDSTLWFCALCGVSRFDGKSWTSYTRFGDLSYPNIQSSCIDSSGAVWLGTLSGAVTYRNSAWQVLRQRDGLLSDSVYALGADARQRLWFATPAGVFAWQNGIAAPTYRTLACSAGSAFRLDPRGGLWLLRGELNGGAKRLYRLAGETWEEYAPELTKHSFAFGPDNTLYIGSLGGFFIIREP